ncbi:MAG: coenzyme F420-0:L-glutamate ligase, partial [Candidatus Bathyarchaeia archaeon]
MHKIEIIPITGLPIIKEGDDLGELISEAARKQGTPIQEGDIVVITHVVVSRAEGNVINIDDVTPSLFAMTIAKKMNKDPALIEVVLQESNSIVRMGNGHIITETKHGLIC